MAPHDLAAVVRAEEGGYPLSSEDRGVDPVAVVRDVISCPTPHLPEKIWSNYASH